MSKQLTFEEKKDKLKAKRLKKIFLARRSLWEFQKITAPSDYKEERTYLLILALCLQSFYEDKPISYDSYLPPEKHQNLGLSGGNIEYTMEDNGEGGTRFELDMSGVDTLIIEIPRRHHKSHSLIIFEDWVFGQDPKHIMITAAHTAELAYDFSTYVRDGIEAERIKPMEIIYSDVFPKTRIKFGDRSKKKWSLEGNFLSYAGAGIMTPVTGKGGNLLVIDDPIKSPLDAFNENHQEKLWMAYSSGWLQTLEKPRRQIMVMTPWCVMDTADRVAKGAKESGEIVKILNLKAWTKEQGCLCEEILDKRALDILKSRLDPVIYAGNYMSTRIPQIGRLYPYFREYQLDELPVLFEEIFCYIDTADEGTDFLAAGLCGITTHDDDNGFQYKNAHMLDVYFTQDGAEITEVETVEFLVRNYREQKERSIYPVRFNVKIESNNGGRYFARNVEEILEREYPEESRNIIISWFFQNENKRARIVSQAHTVMQYVIMPHDWEYRYPKYHEHMTKYIRDGKNTFYDSADMTTGLAEEINCEKSIMDFFNK